ncbi:MAG TPA: glycosyltransferase family 39 protein [Solirubrobacteraceae bacterium]|nr:glycosyltransferase family 39 protein [Solirubrobacteraceae bacterium]
MSTTPETTAPDEADAAEAPVADAAEAPAADPAAQPAIPAAGAPTPPAPPPPITAEMPPPAGRSGPRLPRPGLEHLALAAILVLSAVLNTNRLAKNGYANTFYSAAVKAMLRSWHNFLFVSSDPGGLVTIDKPPLAVWVQAASATVFGFSPLSQLLPEAIISVISVAVLYRVLARRLGAPAGLAGALALAVFPSFVAVSRENSVDPLLILLLILACGAALNAVEDGRWRWLLASAVLVGLAFNTKTLAAYLVVPGIALAYALCAPGAWYRRLAMLLAAGLLMGAVSFAWIGLVELTPASQRPFVGSSTNNTEIGLTFEYNGFGRVEGEAGGPGNIPVGGGALVHTPPGARPVHPVAPAKLSQYLPDGRLRSPIAFGGAPRAARLFEMKLADQGSWMLPFALAGLLAFALLLLLPGGAGPGAAGSREAGSGEAGPGAAGRGEAGRLRRDPRLAALIVFGGWMLVEVAILDFSKGIIHPYYISGLGPGVAAMCAVGVVAFASFARRRSWSLVLLPCALAGTIAIQAAILHYQHYMRWFVPILVAGAVIGLLAMAVRRIAPVATGLILCLLLLAPAVYSATAWEVPVEGTFPAAGPHQVAGKGGYGLSRGQTRLYRRLIAYVDSHHPGTRWDLLTDSSVTAAPAILMGADAAGMAGYSGTDPALSGPGLARLVARGEARYVLLGGAYASRGGNGATAATLHACPQVPHRLWHGPLPGPTTLVLFDCAGRQRQLARVGHGTAVAPGYAPGAS